MLAEPGPGLPAPLRLELMGTQLRYLSAADVETCLPPLARQLELAERSLLALAEADAEMPAKVGVHPRPGALLHAMPAWLRSADVVGMKWVSAFPGNGARGLPSINGLIVLNDPDSGLPRTIMDASRITAVRTAAVSGVAIRLWGQPELRTVAILGAGVQARSHIPVVAALRPGVELRIHDRHPERADKLAAEARRSEGVGAAATAATAREAVDGADLVITVGALGSASQVIGPEWVGSGTLIVAVDFATHASAALARTARAFAVDDRGQFLAYRDSGSFEGYPEPSVTLGEALSTRTFDAGGAGHVLVTHLGVGAADVLFAEEVRLAGEQQDVGMLLPR